MNLKRVIASFITVFFCSAITLNFTPVKAYAQTLNPFDITTTINGSSTNSGTINLVNGKTVSFELNITVNQNAVPGDKIVFKLPKGFKDLSVSNYPKNAFSNCQIDGDTVTLTAGPNIGKTLGAYMGISATLDVGKNSSGSDEPVIGSGSMTITVNNKKTVIKTHITEPATTPSTSTGTSGGGTTGGSGTQGIQHITKIVDGYPNYDIGQVTEKNNVLNYNVTLNTNGMDGKIIFKDPIPKELQLQASSIQITEINHGIKNVTTQLINSNDLKIENNEIIITNLAKDVYYNIAYNALIPAKLAKDAVDQSIINTTYINQYSSSAKVTINSNRRKLTPSEVNNMISKTANTSTYSNLGSNITYTLSINPSCNYVQKSSFVDKMPDGLQISSNANSITTYMKTSTGLLDTNNSINVVTINKNGVVTSKTNYTNSIGTIYVNAQKNEIYGNIDNFSDSIQISYQAKITSMVAVITNKVTMNFDNYKKESSYSIKYSSSAGSIEAWKTVNKATLVDGENPNVQYQIHVVSDGWFPKGYLNITDPLEKGIKLESVKVPSGFTYKVEGNTVKVINSDSIIEPGQSIVIDLNCSLAAFKDGTTIHNQAIINNLKTRTVTTKKGYSFTVQKAEKSNPSNLLQGAIYGVYDSSNTLLYKMTSGKDGYMSGDISKPGSYYLKELVAPKEYALSSEKIPFTITSNDIGTNVNLGKVFDSEITSKVIITKYGKDSAKLAGAKIEIINAAGKVVYTGTTEANGEISTTLPYGTYTYKEVQAPEGYNLSNQVGTINVTTNGAVINESITDSQVTSKVIITKYGADKAKLAGAKIEIINAAGNVVYTGTTDANGQISTVLPYGTYTYKEVQAPKGYNISNQVGTINVTTNGAVINESITDSQVTSKVIITKYGANKEKLAGAKIEIINSAGKVVYTGTTEANGEISTTLPYGTYTYKEVQAPKGYNISNQVGTINVTTNGAVINESITDSQVTSKVIITKYGADKAKLAGAKIEIINSAGNVVYTGTTDANGQISTTLPYGTYTYKEVQAPKGYNISTTVGTINVTTNGAVINESITDSQVTSKVIITKYGANKEKLAGAKIEILNAAGKVVYTGTTDANGQISTTLPYGTYTYKEVQAPKGYNISNQVGTINVTTNGAVINESITDSQVTSKVIITKYGANKEKLAGAKIEIINSAGKVVYTGTTEANGEISTTLPYGTYTYKEVQAPKGYNISTTVGTINVTTNGAVINESITDSQVTSKVIITKYGANKAKLAGAKIEISNAAGKVVYTGTTEANGEISTTLPYGTYTYKEVQAPKGYNISATVGTINVTTNGAVINESITDSQVTSKVIITKYGANKAKLAGAKIEISNAAGKVVYTGTTDANGEISTVLPYGTYTYKEVQAPKGYNISNQVGTINVTTNGAVINESITDSQVTSKVIITKYGANKEKLAGAKIEIINSAGNVVYTGTTDANGQISTTLPYGTYTYKEVQAPKGYNISTTVGTINVTTNGAVINESITDSQVTSKVIITKYGTNKAKLAGAKIEIINAAGKVVYTGTTDANGQISTVLPYGTYTYKEVQAPKGYNLSNQVGTINVTTNGAVINESITDSQVTSKVIITKYGANKAKLAGAKIEIINAAGKVVYTGTTDANGQISTVLPYGTYTYKEVQAPKGYNISTTVGTINVTTNGAVINESITDSEITSKVIITKYGADNVKLAGAKIAIMNADGKVVYEGTTDANGEISIVLPYGTYTYKEVEAPKGYNINDKIGHFDVTTNGQIINEKIIDTKIKVTSNTITNNHDSNNNDKHSNSSDKHSNNQNVNHNKDKHSGNGIVVGQTSGKIQVSQINDLPDTGLSVKNSEGGLVALLVALTALLALVLKQKKK